jgi:enamine deaminase RidA (YjgF/YER057c/UK114 family)
VDDRDQRLRLEGCDAVPAERRSGARQSVRRLAFKNTPEFFVTPGYGERQLSAYHYSQAVRIGHRLETCGQGGWNDAWEFPASLTEEIAQAFRNVERTLAVAGAGWAHVIHVNSCHVGLDGQQEEINQTMTAQFRHYMPDHAPVWTCLGVAALGDPKMRVEIRVTAILPAGRE